LYTFYVKCLNKDLESPLVSLDRLSREKVLHMPTFLPPMQTMMVLIGF
jgi:hypothetical protein